jgi:hypothetical protein
VTVFQVQPQLTIHPSIHPSISILSSPFFLSTAFKPLNNDPVQLTNEPHIQNKTEKNLFFFPKFPSNDIINIVMHRSRPFFVST